jgi:hypothetical protein
VALLILALQPVAGVLCDLNCLRPAAASRAVTERVSSCHEHTTSGELSFAREFLSSSAHCRLGDIPMLPTELRWPRPMVADAPRWNVLMPAPASFHAARRHIDGSPPPLLIKPISVLRI